jgi:Superfamily I DNA and RNA helicases
MPKTTATEAAQNINVIFPSLSPESVAFVQEHGGGMPISGYLDWLSTYDIQDEIKDDAAPGITLATIHAAKGLEWPTVIIAGCNEGLIPSTQAIAIDNIEEERRLMYVAMTRARDQLVIAVRPEVTVDARGKEHINPASRFVGEAIGD